MNIIRFIFVLVWASLLSAHAVSCCSYSGPTESLRDNANKAIQVFKILPSHRTSSTMDDEYIAESIACKFESLHEAAKATGHRITINSGFRSLERQKKLHECYLNKSCNHGRRAAKPGMSQHGWGKALDFQLSESAYKWMTNNAKRFGFYRTVEDEKWHWEYLGIDRGL